MRVASGRASGVKRDKSIIQDCLAVATPDEGRGRKNKKILHFLSHVNLILVYQLLLQVAMSLIVCTGPQKNH